MVNPVDRPDFDPAGYREPNVEMMGRLALLSGEWRAAVTVANDKRAALGAAIVKARDAGHSIGQIRKATGLGVSTIQMTLAKTQPPR